MRKDLAKLTSFHDELNPKLWQNNNLRREVEYKLLQIAKEFVKFINVENLELEDITISGSNCSYNYNDQSDIDLHLVVSSDSPCWPHLQELYLAKKTLFNDKHDIKIRDIDVEVYVQDSKQKHISNGIYSLLKDKWLKQPKKIEAQVDKTNVEHKYRTLKFAIQIAIASGEPDKIWAMQDKIKKMRQSGLDQNGEFGPENLAFKMLRNDGTLDELYTAGDEAEDKRLSLPENAQAEHQKIVNAVIDFYRENTKLKPVDDYEEATKELVQQADTPALKAKLIKIFDKAKDNPYIQGGVITTIGSLIAGGVLGMGQKYGLTPHQTNIVLQAVINTVLPTIISRVNGKDWKDTIKYTLASAGIGTGIAAISENFADGKGPGRPGDSQRHGIPKNATMAELEKASHAKGRKGQLARWQLNMRRGKKKANESLTPADPVEKWIATFKKSTHPKFAGKTPEQREKQARMAHYRAVQNKKTFKEGVAEAGGPDMSRRGFLGGLGALVASSGLPKAAAGALEQILGITTPQHLENMQHALKSRGTMLQFTSREFDKISDAIRGRPLDDWGGWANPRIDQAYKQLTGEEMTASRVAHILKDANIDPVKFFESPRVTALLDGVRKEWAAKWAKSGASTEPFKATEPPKLDKATEPKQLAKPKHKGLADPDEEEELAIGRAGVTETVKVPNELIRKPFKDPVAVLKKYLDKMKDPNWDKIDLLMKKIANRNGIGADQLHKMWVDEYDETPDEYCGCEDKKKDESIEQLKRLSGV